MHGESVNNLPNDQMTASRRSLVARLRKIMSMMQKAPKTACLKKKQSCICVTPPPPFVCMGDVYSYTPYTPHSLARHSFHLGVRGRLFMQQVDAVGRMHFS